VLVLLPVVDFFFNLSLRSPEIGTVPAQDTIKIRVHCVYVSFIIPSFQSWYVSVTAIVAAASCDLAAVIIGDNIAASPIDPSDDFLMILYFPTHFLQSILFSQQPKL